MMDEARLVEELDGLKAHTEVLKEQTIAQPDNRDAIQLYVSLNNRIAALENRLMTIQQSRVITTTPQRNYISEVNIHSLALSAATACCRTLLESFANQFRTTHQIKYEKKCSRCLDVTDSMTSVFKHFEVRPAVADSNKLLLGNDLSNIKLPTKGDFATLYHKLSEHLHEHPLTYIDEYVLVPGVLGGPEIRFLVRFIAAKLHKKVLIATGDKIRPPLPHEITTPPKEPTGKSKTSSSTATRLQGPSVKLHGSRRRKAPPAKATPPKRPNAKANGSHQEQGPTPQEPGPTENKKKRKRDH